MFVLYNSYTTVHILIYNPSTPSCTDYCEIMPFFVLFCPFFSMTKVWRHPALPSLFYEQQWLLAQWCSFPTYVRRLEISTFHVARLSTLRGGITKGGLVPTSGEGSVVSTNNPLLTAEIMNQRSQITEGAGSREARSASPTWNHRPLQCCGTP